MAQTSFAAYLVALRKHEQAFIKAAEKAVALDAMGALPPQLADTYYTMRDQLFLQQVAAVNVVRERVLTVHPALVNLVPSPALGPDLPRTPPTRLPPDQSSAPSLAVRERESGSTGLGNPAAVAIPPVITIILVSVALMVVVGGVTITISAIAQTIEQTKTIEAFDRVLSRRSSYITMCKAQGGNADACIEQANRVFPTPADGLPPRAETPWYLRGSTYAILGGLALTAYILSIYKKHVGPEPTRFSAGIAGSFALPKQLKSGQPSTSTYGLEV